MPDPMGSTAATASRRLRALRLLLLAVSCAVVSGGFSTGRTLAFSSAVSQATGSPAAIVGLWLVAPFPDRPSDQELALFATGGFMFASNPPVMPAMPGQTPPGVTQLFSSQGLGLWQAQPDGTVAFKFLLIQYDQNGGYLGNTSIHGSLTLDPSVATFSGTYVVTVTFPDGTSMDAQGSTPVTGSRAGF